MSKTIQLSIESHFRDQGVKDAIAAFNKLFAKINGNAHGNGVDALADATKELAKATAELTKVTRQYNQQQQQQNQNNQNNTNNTNKYTQALERQFALMRKGSRLAGQVNKELEERQDAVKELTDAEQALSQTQTKLNALRTKEQQLLAKGNTTAEERAQIAREIKSAQDDLAASSKKAEAATNRLTRANTALARAQDHLQDMGDFIAQNKLTGKHHPLIKVYRDLEDQIKETGQASHGGVLDDAAINREITRVRGLITGLTTDLDDVRDGFSRTTEKIRSGTLQMHRDTEKSLNAIREAYRGVMNPIRALDTLQSRLSQNGQKRAQLLDREQKALQRVADAQAKVAEIERRALAGEKPNSRLERLAQGDLRSAENELNRVQRELGQMDVALNDTKARFIAMGQAATANIRQARAAYAALSQEARDSLKGMRAHEDLQRMEQEYARFKTTLKGAFQTVNAEQNAVQAQTKQTASGLTQVQDGFDGLTRAAHQNSSSWAQLTGAMNANKSVAQATANLFRSLRAVAAQLAATISGHLVNGLQRASTALSSLTSGAAGKFAALRSNLDSTGSAFSLFGKRAEDGMGKYDRALEHTAAGWSMLLAGQGLTQMANTLGRNGIQGLSQYLQFEEAATLAAVSTRQTPQYIEDLVYGLGRGQFGDPIKTLSNIEMAQGIYFYGSAIGQDITDQNKDAVLSALVPMLQLAGFTQSSPETTIKGVLNAAMEFGVNPRDIQASSPMLRDISNLFGYLANESTMEVPDIAEFFKMVGPLANVLSPHGTGGSIKEAMALAYMASEMGLRGGNPGRGLNSLLSSLLDPTDKSNATAERLWGTDVHSKFFATDKDGKYVLRDGLKGLFTPFLEMTDAEWKQAQAEMFTQGASRVAVPLIDQLRAADELNPDKWDEIIAKLDSGEALDFINDAATTASQTMSAAVQDMQNAWTEFVGTIANSASGEITGAIGAIANGLRELADIVHAIPGLGKFFTVFAAGLTAAMAAFGALLTLMGTFLILQRAFIIAGSGVSTFVAALRAIPMVLAMSLPLLLALAAAALALKVAWDANFLGIRDGVKAVRDAFSGDFSASFLSLLDSDRFAALYQNVMRVAAAFKELVAGILFDTGDTNNLFALINTVFGDLLGNRINHTLIALRGGLSDLRAGFADLFSGIGQGLPSLETLGRSLRGVLEQLFTGTMSYDSFTALNDLGGFLGIDDLGTRAQVAVRAVQAAFQSLTGYLQGVGAVVRDVFARIWENVQAIFSLDNIIAALSFALNVIQGFGMAVAAGFLLAVAAVERLTAALASLGRVGSFLNDIIASVTGVRLSLDNLGMVIGAVLGTMFVGRLLLAVGPLRALISLVGQFAFTLVGVGVRVTFLAAQLAVLAARFVLVNGAAALSAVATTSWNLLTSGVQAASAAAARGIISFTGLATASLGLAGILALAAVGLYAFVAATQGFDRANALARAFFDGLMTGARAIGAVLVLVWEGIQRIVAVAQALPGVGDNFASAESAARLLGIAIAGLIGLALASTVVGWVANLSRLTGGFGLAGGAATKFRLVIMGLGVLGVAGAFDPLIGALDRLIDKLNETSIAGAGAGNMLMGLVGGAAGGAWLGKAAGPWGALAGGILGGGLGVYGAYQADKQAETSKNLQKALQGVEIDLGTGLKLIPTVDISGQTYQGDRYVSFQGTNPVTGQKDSKFTIDKQTDAVYDYGGYRLPGTTLDQFSQVYVPEAIPPDALAQYNAGLDKIWQGALQGRNFDWQGEQYRAYYNSLSQAEKDALAQQGVRNEGEYANYAWVQDLQKTKSTYDAAWLAANPGASLPVPEGGFQSMSSFIPLIQGEGTRFVDPKRIAPGQPVLNASARAAYEDTPVLGAGGVATNPPSQAVKASDENFVKRVMRQSGLGKLVNGFFGGSGSAFLDYLGVDSLVGGDLEEGRDPRMTGTGYSLTDMLGGQGKNRIKTKWDDYLPDFLPEDLKKELDRWKGQQDDWNDFQKVLDATGGDMQAASDMWRATTGRGVPGKPLGLDQHIRQLLSDEDMAEAIQLAEAEQQKFIDFNTQVMDSYNSADIPTAMRAVFSGPSYRTPEGNLGRGVSGAEALMTYADPILQNMGDSMPWMNQQEILADAGIEGLLMGNLAGVNMHTALAPLFKKWSAESGIAVEDLMKDIPRFFADPKYMTQATTDLAQMFEAMPTGVLRELDTLGMAEGFEQYGLDWADMTEFAISNAMAGQDWNLQDYIEEAWGLSSEQARQFIADHPLLDANSITSGMFADLQGQVNSMGGEIVALTQDQWKFINEATKDGTDKTIEITQEAFSSIPDYLKIAMANMGIQFVIGGTAAAAQAGATAQLVADQFRAKYGDAWKNVEQAVLDGTAEVTRTFDEAGTEWVEITDQYGNTITVPAMEYDGFMQSAETLKQIANGTYEALIRLKQLMEGSVGPSGGYQVGGSGYNQDTGYINGDGWWVPFNDSGIPGQSKDPARFWQNTVTDPVTGKQVPANYSTGYNDTIGYNTKGGAPALLDQANSGQLTGATTTAFYNSMGMPTAAQAGTDGQAAGTAWNNGFVLGATGGGTTTASGGSAAPITLDNLMKIDPSTITAKGQEIGQKVYAAIQAGLTAAMAAPAGGMSSDFESGMVTSYTGTSPFDTMFEQYATTAVERFKTKLTTELRSALGEIGTLLQFGEGFEPGMAAGGDGGGTSPFDAVFESYATTAVQKFKTKLGQEMSTAMQPDKWQITSATGGAITTGAFDGIFEQYAVTAAKAFRDKLGTELSAAMAGAGEGAEGDTAAIQIPIEIDFDAFNSSVMSIGAALSALTLIETLIPIDADLAPFNEKILAVGLAGAALELVTYTATLDAADNASSVIGTVIGLLQFYAVTWTATLTAIDSASGLIGTLIGLVQHYAQTWTATLGVVDNASGAIGGVIGMLQMMDGMVATATMNTVQTTYTQTVALGGGGANLARGGVSLARGGLSLVGERGPELLALPYGSRVVSNYDTMLRLRDHFGFGSSLTSGGGVRGADLGGMLSSPLGVMSPQPMAARAHQARRDGGALDGGVSVHFHGPVTMTSETDERRFATTVKRVVSEEIRLAERGMTSTD